MAVSAIEFWQQLIRIGVVDTATARLLAQRFKTAKDKKPPKAGGDGVGDEAVSVAQFLIANRILTRFQSQRLLAGRAGELRVGEYVVVDRCDRSPLSRWHRARHIGRPQECFLYPCTDSLTSARWVDPAWLKSHAAVACNGLQPIEPITLVASDPWRGAVVSEFPDGRSLEQWLTEQGPNRDPRQRGIDRSTAASIGKVIADALASMHEAGLMHGEVRPSRVWCGEDKSLWLLRDAGRPPIAPDETPQEHRWLDADSSSAAYRAPELDLPGAVPSVSSDLFSLGMTIFHLAQGVTDRRDDKPFSLPAEVAQARDAGPFGDPLLRTLAYAMDPNPAARFADVRSFSRALAVVLTTYESESPAIEPEASSDLANPSIVLEPPPQAPLPEQNRTATKPMDASASSPALTASSPASALPEPDLATKKQTVAPVPKVPPATKTPRAPQVGQATKSVDVSPESVEAPKIADAPKNAEALITSPAIPANAQAIADDSDAKGSEPRKRVRKKTRRTRRGPIIVGSIAATALIGILAIFLRPSSEEPAPRIRPTLPPRAVVRSAPSDTPTPNDIAGGTKPVPTVSATPDGEAAGYELVNDDRLLWASPWPPDSKPASLELVPPGSQLIATLRLSRLIGEDASSDWLDWLGAELGPALQQLQKRSGLLPKEIERLTIAYSAGASGHPQVAYAVVPHEPISLKSSTELWKVSASRTRDGKTIYTDDTPDGDTYFVRGSGDQVDAFAFGPVDQISLVAENDGNEIPLARSLAQLWNETSSDADVVVLAVPNFLFADGRELLTTYAPRAIEPLKSILIPDIAAASITMGMQESWYLETRLSPSGNVSAPAMLQSIEPLVRKLPEWAEAFAVDSNVDPSWRAMAIRLPQFMRALSDQTRFGVSESLPMFNFHLPPEAAPQLTLATVLAMSSANASVAVVETTQPMPALSAEELLDVKFSVSFDQESLEFSISVISDEFTRALPQGSAAPKITIVGGDLEKSGITQNQQIRNFQIRDMPLRSALSEIVKQANPDKTAVSLTDKKQTLVWVIDPASTLESPGILITTRPAAEAKQLKLPAEFVES